MNEGKKERKENLCRYKAYREKISFFLRKVILFSIYLLISFPLSHVFYYFALFLRPLPPVAISLCLFLSRFFPRAVC